jgi:uncharacterized protein (TIGR03067 family)
MTRFVLLAAVMVCGGVAAADEAADRKAAKDLEGSYDLVRMARDGMDVPAEVVKSITGVTIKDGELTLKKAGAEDKATFKVTAGTKPAAIDITSATGETRPGIYQMDRGELTIVFQTAEKTRPAGLDDKTKGAMKLVLKKK